MSTFLEKGDVFDDGDLDNFNIGWDIISSTLKSWYNESWFNEIPCFSALMPAHLNYFTIVNSIQFSELHDLVNKTGQTASFIKSRLGCTYVL